MARPPLRWRGGVAASRAPTQAMAQSRHGSDLVTLAEPVNKASDQADQRYRLSEIPR